MNHPWQYDEKAQIGTDYANREEVARYDQRMGALRDVAREAADIQRALMLSSDAVVWEIGTGTGECALALAATVKHVYATDVSAAMLDYAQHKAERKNAQNVTFHDGGFLSGFVPPQPVDGVVTQLALHHLPDFWKARALANIAAHLRHGGRLYLRDVVFPSSMEDYDRYFKAVIDEMASRAGDDMATQTIQHIKKEYSTLDWILEGMLTRSGLKIIEKDCRGFLSVYVCEK